MQVSKKDVIVMGVIAVAFALIGFGLGWRSKTVPVVDEDSKFVEIRKEMDSLKIFILTNNAHIDTLYSHEKQDDINRNNNFKTIANELKQVRHFNTPTRSKYLDSLAAVKGL